jgi:hypothetical protein
LDTVDTSVTLVDPGREFDDGQFTVTIDRARVVDELRAGRSVVAHRQPGSRYVGVVATVRNDGTVPGRLQGELDLVSPSPARFVAAVRLDDGSRVITLGPGLQQQLGFVWAVPDGAVKPGDAATVRLWHKTFQQGFVTYGEMWVPSLTEYGQIEVPIGGPT